MLFDVTNFVCLIFIVYALFSLFQSKTAKGKTISGLVILVAAAILVMKYVNLSPEGVDVTAPIFQQFNPCFVVMLTPVSMAIFSWLASKGKEPSAPRKIGLGMLVAGCGYVIMMIGSMGLTYGGGERVSPNWLVSTYLVLTFGELFALAYGHLVRFKGCSSQVQGLDDGRLVRGYGCRQHACFHTRILVGATLLSKSYGAYLLCFASCRSCSFFSIMKKLEKVC